MLILEQRAAPVNFACYVCGTRCQRFTISQPEPNYAIASPLNEASRLNLLKESRSIKWFGWVKQAPQTISSSIAEGRRQNRWSWNRIPWARFFAPLLTKISREDRSYRYSDVLGGVHRKSSDLLTKLKQDRGWPNFADFSGRFVTCKMQVHLSVWRTFCAWTGNVNLATRDELRPR